MKKFIKPYRHLLALMAVIILAVSLMEIGMNPFAACLLVFCYQGAQFAMSKGYRRGIVRISALTDEQVKEFDSILQSFKGYGGMFKDLDAIAKSEGGFAAIRKLPGLLADSEKRVDEVSGNLKKLQRLLATNQHSTGVRWIGNVPFVTDDCARSLSANFVLQCQALGNQAMKMVNGSTEKHAGLIAQAREYLGLPAETKASPLTPTEIPLPTIYVPQIIELVFAYGQARQNATVFPLGAGTIKLPRLKAGEDDFGFLGVGTAGMSQAIGEKKVTAELVTFTANKFGGLIRIPTELEEDTFVPLGQFLARYIGRQMAKGEDKTLFLGDGTGTYANIVGVKKYCETNAAYLTQLASTKTHPSDATIADFRAMRAQVNAAVLMNMAANGQTAACYYMHPTMDSLLVTFNTINNPLIYVRRPDGTATLDGFPVKWIGVSQPYTTAVAASTALAFFGDLSYWYLGERGSVRVEVSKEVFFATDELAMRALERIDVENMAVDAMSTLETAAA